MDNRVRRTIIKRLLYAPKLRYAKIKPKNIEGNLFTYHLRKLVSEGLVQKTKDGFYSMSAQGKLYIDRLSLKTLSPRIQPKIITLLIVNNKEGEYLVYKRKREPFSGSIGFPHGKIHLGESVFESAQRELMEKAGFDTKLTHRGEVYATVFQDGELVTHILCHVFSGTVPSKKPNGTDRDTKCYWANVDGIENSKYLPAFGDIFDLVKKSKTRFFKEFVYHL